MDATKVYGNALAEYLYDTNHKVKVVYPDRMKCTSRGGVMRTNKHNHITEHVARFCESLSPSLWNREPINVRQPKAMVRRLDMLIDTKRPGAPRLDLSDEVVQSDIHQLIKMLEQRIKKIRTVIERHNEHDRGLQDKKELLHSIPGIGEKPMATVLSNFAEINNCDNGKKLASFCGTEHHEHKRETL